MEILVNFEVMFVKIEGRRNISPDLAALCEAVTYKNKSLTSPPLRVVKEQRSYKRFTGVLISP